MAGLLHKDQSTTTTTKNDMTAPLYPICLFLPSLTTTPLSVYHRHNHVIIAAKHQHQSSVYFAPRLGSTAIQRSLRQLGQTCSYIHFLTVSTA